LIGSLKYTSYTNGPGTRTPAHRGVGRDHLQEQGVVPERAGECRYRIAAGRAREGAAATDMVCSPRPSRAPAKLNVIVVVPGAYTTDDAGIPLTVKSDASTLAASAGSEMPTVNTVGGTDTTLPTTGRSS